VINYNEYESLLKQIRGSTKYWIPQLCQALKEENSNNLSNKDIRDKIMKDCISIWQKEDAIRNVLPDAIKEKYDKREWHANILFSIKPFNNTAVEGSFYITATGLSWSLIQDLENFGFEIRGVRPNNSDSVNILVERCLHHYLQGRLYYFGSYTKRNRQVHGLHDRGSEVVVAVVAVVAVVVLLAVVVLVVGR
jgi:hypothetical protein